VNAHEPKGPRLMKALAVLVALISIACGNGTSTSSGASPVATAATNSPTPTVPPSTPTSAATTEPTKTPSPFVLEMTGVVVDKSGAPIPGARLDLYQASAGCSQFNVGQKPVISVETTSGPDGGFILRVATRVADAQGRYFLYAQASGRFVFYDQQGNCSGATIVTSATPSLATIRLVLP